MPDWVAEGLTTKPEAGSRLLAADMSKTWSTTSGHPSSRCEPAVIVWVRFRVIRERRVRLAPLLLAVLANEFEREGPESDMEEGSGMGCALVPPTWRGSTC